jgi:serine/threonine protein kinase
LALLSGDPSSEMLRAHLLDCSRCRSRFDTLQREVSAIRLTGQASAAPTPASADRVPGSPSSACSSPALRKPTSVLAEPQPSTEARRPAGAPDSADHYLQQSSAHDDEPIPAAIGKYLVVGSLPSSPGVEVFRVVHPGLRRDLVLELAHRSIVDSGRSDVLGDPHRLAELAHPNIVPIHDLGRFEGRPYLVMEYIRGRTLAQYAHDEAVSPVRAAALVASVAGAVAFADRRGVAHRCIAPANVLVDEAGQPRLTGFGLDWLRDPSARSNVESEGEISAYTAPEQARADPQRTVPLSDVFSLGALLYFLLTGKAPFDAATPAEARDRAGRCEFDRSALKNAGVPRRLQWICLKAMDCTPNRRFPSAARLEQALRFFGNGRLIAIAATASILILVLVWLILSKTWAAPRTAPPPFALPLAAPPSKPALPDESSRIVKAPIERAP